MSDADVPMLSCVLGLTRLPVVCTMVYMDTTTATRIATDNVRTLAKRYNMTRAAVRATATDLGLTLTYSPTRHTWIIAEDATTVRAFNEHLAD